MSERSPARIVKAYELSIRSPQEVYEWLSHRPQDTSEVERDWDEETEMALLGRNEPLIELGLARYSNNHSRLRRIFTNRLGQAEGDTAIRLTLLCYGRSSKPAAYEFPQLLFEDRGGKVAMTSWLTTASENDISALFSNPALSKNFLLNFFEQKEVWEAITEENRHVAIRAFNAKSWFSESCPSPGLGGYVEDEFRAVFTAAWKLVETVDTTLDWATTLAVMVGRMSWIGPGKDARIVATRWAGPDPAKEENTAKLGHLTCWQQIRRRLFAPGRSPPTEPRDEYLKSDDIAVRAVGYAYCQFTPEEVKVLGADERALVLNCLFDNPSMWRNKELRGAVYDLCWELDAANEGGTWDNLSRYHCLVKEWSEMLPEWFEDENNAEYDARGALINPDDKPVTVGMFNEKVEELTSSVTRHIDDANQRLMGINSIAVLILLGVIGLIIYLVRRG